MFGPKVIAMAFTLRRATASDADEIANVYYASFRLLTFLLMLHTIEEYRWFVSNVTLKRMRGHGCRGRKRDRRFSRATGRRGPSPLYAPRSDRHGCGHLANRYSKGQRCRCTRTVVLSGQCTRTALLRGARVSRHPLYGRRGQRGADA
jgi:hypothetical protein